MLLMLATSVCSAQESYENISKQILGTWNLDSLYIGGIQQLPEPLIRKLNEQMQESKAYTKYYFGEDGKYINETKANTLEGSWKLSQFGDTLTLILPDKIINNKILYLNNESLAIEPQNETKEVENSRIFMVRRKDDQ